MKCIYAFLTCLLLVGTCLTFSACGDDDGADARYNTGTWYLDTFHGSQCTWGEYMRFSGKTVYWNNRLGGRNTTYTAKYTASGFTLTNSSDQITFSAYKSGKKLVTSSSDGETRQWRR